MGQNSGCDLILVGNGGSFGLPALPGAKPAQAPSGKSTFSFVYRSIPLSIVVHDAAPEATLEVVGDVGPMPFSAESALARAGLRAIVDTANERLGEIFRVVDNRIRLVGSLKVAHPVTSVRLVTALAQFLLPAKPYLETTEVFIEPAAGGKDGLATLRPHWRRAGRRART